MVSLLLLFSFLFPGRDGLFIKASTLHFLFAIIHFLSYLFQKTTVLLIYQNRKPCRLFWTFVVAASSCMWPLISMMFKLQLLPFIHNWYIVFSPIIILCSFNKFQLNFPFIIISKLLLLFLSKEKKQCIENEMVIQINMREEYMQMVLDSFFSPFLAHTLVIWISACRMCSFALLYRLAKINNLTVMHS